MPAQDLRLKYGTNGARNPLFHVRADLTSRHASHAQAVIDNSLILQLSAENGPDFVYDNGSCSNQRVPCISMIF
jgi:hypothetical protein